MATRVAQQAPGLATASPALVSSKRLVHFDVKAPQQLSADELTRCYHYRCPPLTDSELEEFQACVRSLPAKHRSNHHPTLRPQAHEPMPVDQPAIPSPASHSKAPSDTTHNASMGKVSNSSPGLSNGATTGRRLREDIALLRELREQRILLREAMKCRAEEKRTRTPITRKQIAPSLLTTFLKDGDSTEGGSHGKEFARSLNAQSPRNDEGCDARWQALARKTLADVEYATVALLNVLSHFEDQLPLEVSFAIERLKTAAKKRYSRRTATRAFAQFVLEWNKFPDLSRKIAVQLDGRWEFGGWAVRMQNWIGQTHGMRYFEFDGAKMAVAIEHENRAFLKAHCPTYQWVVASWIGRLAMYCMQCDNDRKGVAKMNPDMVFPPPSFLAWARWQCDLEEEPDVLEALRN